MRNNLPVGNADADYVRKQQCFRKHHSWNVFACKQKAIASANPDIIIDAGPVSKDVLNTVKTDPITKEVNAVKNDRVYGVFNLAKTEYTLTTQSFLNSLAIHAMFVFESKLNFEINNYMDNEYDVKLQAFWAQINA